MKKILALLLALVLVLGLAACGEPAAPVETNEPNETTEQTPENTAATLKVGVVLVGDENEGYTYSHIDGIRKAMEATGLTEADVIWKYSIPEDESCYEACVDCAEQGCNLVVTNSYGHQSHCQQAAKDYPDVQFVAMTGDTAKASGLANFHNAFTRIYEARYVGGIVAGMKLNELIADGKLTDKNYKPDGTIRVGYVGAFPYAEVVSGYTAFFLGIKSVCENVSMDVQYTNSWFDPVAESEAAQALMASGCVIIGQHADSTGAPAACEEALNAGTVVYSVGYNVDMLAVAPNAALTSPTNKWAVYYTEIFQAMLDGKTFDTNWAEGYDMDAVAVTELGSSCAPGTAEAVEQAIADIKAGTIKVFDTTTFTVDGEEVTTAYATDTDGDFVQDADEAIFDGCYNESYYQSAPSFTLRIDGITELN